MNSTDFYSARELSRFRLQASWQHADPDSYHRDGWSKSKLDPMKTLACFGSLKIKPGFVLRAYQYVSASNGNGLVWAMPEGSPFPDPAECLKLDDDRFEYPRPRDADGELMKYVTGDGSNLSYISASLLSRELSELGAIWHGCSWSSHSFLDDKFNTEGIDLRELGSWQWFPERPSVWQPSVTRKDNQVIVTFYTYTGLGTEAIVRHKDTFPVGSYQLVTESTTIAEGPGGYVY